MLFVDELEIEIELRLEEGDVFGDNSDSFTISGAFRLISDSFEAALEELKLKLSDSGDGILSFF